MCTYVIYWNKFCFSYLLAVHSAHSAWAESKILMLCIQCSVICANNYPISSLQSGRTPLDLARQNGRSDVVALLEKGEISSELNICVVCAFKSNVVNYVYINVILIQCSPLKLNLKIHEKILN